MLLYMKISLKTLNYTTSLFVVAGICLTFRGIYGLQWPGSLPWQGHDVLVRYIFCSGLIFLAIYLSAQYFKLNPFFAGFCVAAMIVLLGGQPWPLIVVLWVFLSSFLIGAMVVSKFLQGDRQFPVCLKILIGMAINAMLVSLIAHFPINYPGLYAALLMLPILFGFRVALSEGSTIINSLYLTKNLLKS